MSTNWRRFVLAFAVIVSLLLCALPVVAQQATGKIVGTITDPQGAVLPGVTVTVVNTATGAKTVTQTDKDGYFQVLNLPVGTYRITAAHTGFRDLAATTQPLQINQAMRVDLHMQIGAREEVVEVGSAAATVETINATIGQSVTSRPITDMPLNGRNVLDLALLQPGVTEVNPGATNNAQAGSFGISGGKSDAVTYLLDGGLNNDLLSNGAVYLPTPDTIAEFRILSSNYSAEYGRNAGGVVSIVTKSGSTLCMAALLISFATTRLTPTVSSISRKTCRRKSSSATSSAAHSVVRPSRTSCSFSVAMADSARAGSCQPRNCPCTPRRN
jgi:hypothetical protein